MGSVGTVYACCMPACENANTSSLCAKCRWWDGSQLTSRIFLTTTVTQQRCGGRLPLLLLPCACSVLLRQTARVAIASTTAITSTRCDSCLHAADNPQMRRRARFDVADVGYGDLEAHQVADGIKAFKESHDDNGGQGGSSVRAGSASAARTGVGGVTARAPTRGSLTLGKRERGEGKGHGKISDAREASPEAVEHSKARRSDNGEPEELARRSKRLPASSSGSPLSRGGRGTRKVAGGGVSDGESNAASPSPHIASPSRKHARPQDASGVGEGADATADGGRGKRVRMPKKRFEQSGSSPK